MDARLSIVSAPLVPVAAPGAPVVLLAGFGGALGGGLRDVIERGGDLRVVVAEGDGDLAGVVAEHRPAVALVSFEALEGVVALRRLVLAHPETGVVVAVMRLSGARDQALLSAGARVVVPITEEATYIRAALRLVADGLVGPSRAQRRAAGAGLGLLTGREVEVVELLVARRTAREIAAALQVAPATVNAHRRRIYEKLGIHSRDELAQLAEGIEPGERDCGSARSLARERLAFRRRVSAPHLSALDLRAALGVARWRR